MTVDLGVFILAVTYIGMAAYIVYLQYRVHKVRNDLHVMVNVVRDFVEGNIEVEKMNDGFKIRRSTTEASR